MCKWRLMPDCESEHCSHCPPQKIMNDLFFVIDFYYDNLKVQEKERKEKIEK